MIMFPICTLTPNSVSFIPTFRNTSGSVSLSGASQTIASSAGIWQAKLIEVSLRNAAHVILWETIEIRLQGRLNPILIPLMEGSRQPFPLAQSGSSGSIPFSDGAYFSDGSGFYGSVIIASLASAISRGATTGAITVSYGRQLRPRDYFSIGDRLYRIDDVTEIAGSTYTVKFWPPAREAAASGAYVEFDQPRCKMRLKQDDGMAVDKSFSKFASPTVEFVEDLS
ncbi:hypothetical protein [Aureimonas glaciei]|uniref:Uncharacterized protein n=1 Tax=Aureimonas glaciei TaxID=1776957 RepID=A0A916Y5M8_9HYPH|nr:hypothetical protein [Aureimonas glaciei]GGD30699.1 hypothetical protein GCM10011335_37200 [Aureimonas glaciei]